MYSFTFIQTLRSVEENLEQTLDSMNHLDDPTASRNLDRTLDCLMDYTTLFAEIEFTVPRTEPDSSELTTSCLRQMRDEGPLRLRDVPEPKHRRIEESELFRTVSGYVLVPLGSSGAQAFSWLPLLSVLEEMMQSISESLNRLSARARTDCDDFMSSVWTATCHMCELLTMHLTIKHDTHRKVNETEPFQDVVHL